MSKITEEIERLRNKLGLSQVSMGEILGVTDKTYSKKISSGEGFTYGAIDNLILFLFFDSNVDIPYTLSDLPTIQNHLNNMDIEEAALNRGNSDGVNKSKYQVDIENILKDMSKMKKQNASLDNKIGLMQIPYYNDIRSSAGFGAINGMAEKPETITLSKNLIPSASKTTETIKCSGDSMSPSLQDGDIMFIDRACLNIDDGEIYVIRVEDELYVKRLVRVPGKIIAKSDNSIYPDFELVGDNFEVLGRVIYRMGKV